MVREISRRTPSPTDSSAEIVTSSYEAVPNPALRQFLDTFEYQVMQGIDDPFPGYRLHSHLQLTTLTGMPTWDIDNLYNLVRPGGVIEFTREPRGHSARYFLEKDGVRAFAAFCWWTGSHPPLLENKNLQVLVSGVREALGLHPLAKLLKDPTSPQQRRANTDIKQRGNAEIDFSSGKFWETPLGRSVEEFAREIPLGDRHSSIKTSRAAILLKLRHFHASYYFITALAGSGILAGVERQPTSRHYHLRPEHVLISGLVLLYLEKGYSPETIVEKLPELLEGTSLRQFVGSEMRFLEPLRRRDFFNQSSPWRDFPLEEVPRKEASKAIMPKEKPPSQSTPQIDQADRVDERTTYAMNIDGAVARVDSALELRKKSLLERAPKPTEEQLREMRVWGTEELQQLRDRLPDNFEEVSLSRLGVPLEVIQVAMFIHAFVKAARGQVEKYDSQLDFLIYGDLRIGLSLSLRYMEKYPQCRNLAILFLVIKKELREKAQIDTQGSQVSS